MRTAIIFNTLLVLITVAGIVSCTQSHSESGKSGGAISEKGKNNSGVFSFLTAPKTLKPVEYVKWVEDEHNGLIKHKRFGRFKYSLRYKPTDYMIVKDAASETIPVSLYDSLKNVYSGFEYYTFSIHDTLSMDELLKTNLKSRSEYDERLLYFSFEMQKDIQLVSGTDTIPCSLLHFERTYNISPQANFMLGFPVTKENNPGDKILIFEDKVFGIGLMKLKIKEEDLSEVPVLKIN